MCKILSFDIGLKNLSYCYINVTPLKIELLDWQNISVTDENCKKIKLDEITFCLLQTLNERFTDDYEADIVLIENQPALKNGMIKTVSVIIYTYFNMLKLQYGNIANVQFINASNKLKCNKMKNLIDAQKNTYKDRKKTSIELARLYVIDLFPEKLEWFNTFKKKDDLSDVLNQAIYYIETVLKYSLDNKKDI